MKLSATFTIYTLYPTIILDHLLQLWPASIRNLAIKSSYRSYALNLSFTSLTNKLGCFSFALTFSTPKLLTYICCLEKNSDTHLWLFNHELFYMRLVITQRSQIEGCPEHSYSLCPVVFHYVQYFIHFSSWLPLPVFNGCHDQLVEAVRELVTKALLLHEFVHLELPKR